VVRPCKHHGEVERYPKSGKCVLCVSEYNRSRAKLRRGKGVKCICGCGGVALYPNGKYGPVCKREYNRRWRLDNKEWKLEYNRRWLADNPDRAKAYEQRVRLKKYGVTPGGYRDLLVKQNGVCAICERECPTGKALSVDHDHKTGFVRGLLCIKCNRALGLLSDDVDRLLRAVVYLQTDSESRVGLVA